MALLTTPLISSILPCKKLKSGLLAVSACVFLASCGGGGGISLGSEEAASPDPIFVDRPIAYIKRTLTVEDEDGDTVPTEANILEPRTFNGGAAVFVRTRASNNADEVDITSSQFPGQNYDVKDLTVSHDGTLLAFAMRAPLIDGADEDEQPTWNIWQYEFSTGNLRRVIASDIEAEAGHDISPMYLPDLPVNRLVFSSTRQARGQAILQDEALFYNKGVFSSLTDSRSENIGHAFNLHVMNADERTIVDEGQNIQQITVNQSHDLQPALLDNGKIVFLRWDRAENRNQLSLYTVNPDGSDVSFLYGFHDQNETTNGEDATFFDIAELPDGQIMAILKQRNNTDDGNDNPILGGDLITIDVNNFTETDQGVASNAGASGPAQRSLALDTISIDNSISAGGYYNSAAPLYDGTDRILISWSPCRLNNPDNTAILSCLNNLGVTGVTEADPLYGLWIYDQTARTVQPIATPANEGDLFTDVVVAAPRSRPDAISSVTDTSGFGTLLIDSIYDFDGTLAQTPSGATLTELADPANAAFASREARFMRFVKAVSMPDDDTLDFDNSAFGISTARSMREILGYVPIEPDGSMVAKVPANVAFHIEIVDAQGQRLPGFQLHRNWLSLASGETRQCTGCHTRTSELPHGRRNAEADSINPGAPAAGTPFPNTTPALVISSGANTSPAGQTMAERYLSISGARDISPNLSYVDEWTDTTSLTAEAPISLRYADTSTDPMTNLVTIPPTNDECLQDWEFNCRIIINYEAHIQPLWEVARATLPVATDTCISCHSRTDAMGNSQAPGGQLELTNGPSQFNADHFTSYRELFQTNLPLIINPSNTTQFLTIYTYEFIDGVQQFYLDADDDPILDINGDPIPAIRVAQVGDNNLLVETFDAMNQLIVFQDSMSNDILDAAGNPIPVVAAVDASDIQNPNTMRASNAAGSRFFDVMNGTIVDTQDHSGFMPDEELRLISEWLDIGAQYYNNPFDAPLN